MQGLPTSPWARLLTCSLCADKKPMTESQKERLEKLKKTPRRRPDWSTMMKEISQPRSLKKVECNDRSAPIVKNLKRKDNEVDARTEACV